MTMNSSNQQRKVIAIVVWIAAVVIALAYFEQNKGGPYERTANGARLVATLIAAVGVAIGRAIWPRG